MFRHLSSGWWVATGLVLITGVTKSICSLEQLLCQKYKRWSRRTRWKSSHIFFLTSNLFLCLLFHKLLKKKNEYLATVNIHTIFRIKIKWPTLVTAINFCIMAIFLKIVLDYKYLKWKAVYPWLLQVYKNSVSNQNLTQRANLGHFKSPG